MKKILNWFVGLFGYKLCEKEKKPVVKGDKVESGDVGFQEPKE